MKRLFDGLSTEYDEKNNRCEQPLRLNFAIVKIITTLNLLPNHSTRINYLMRRKHFYWSALVALVLACASTACSDDNETWPSVDGKNPEIAIDKSVIGGRPGQTLHITGTVNDADGLSQITLECLPLYLDKRIDLLSIYGEAKSSYELDYQITSDLSEAGDKFDVLVSAFDVLGNSTSTTVTIDMNGDIEVRNLPLLRPKR